MRRRYPRLPREGGGRESKPPQTSQARPLLLPPPVTPYLLGLFHNVVLLCGAGRVIALGGDGDTQPLAESNLGKPKAHATARSESLRWLVGVCSVSVVSYYTGGWASPSPSLGPGRIAGRAGKRSMVDGAGKQRKLEDDEVLFTFSKSIMAVQLSRFRWSADQSP